MKIRSKIDVITNSSTEVFILKTEDLRKAKEEIYNDKTKYFLDQFIDIGSIEDFKKLYVEHWGYYIFDDLPVWLLREYKIAPQTRKVLSMFGHTPEEIKSFEDRENDKRKKLIEETKAFDNIIGYSTAEFYDHDFWGSGNELVEWLKKNGIKDYRYERP